jgi:hypothetical protein
MHGARLSSVAGAEKDRCGNAFLLMGGYLWLQEAECCQAEGRKPSRKHVESETPLGRSSFAAGRRYIRMCASNLNTIAHVH